MSHQCSGHFAGKHASKEQSLVSINIYTGVKNEVVNGLLNLMKSYFFNVVLMPPTNNRLAKPMTEYYF